MTPNEVYEYFETSYKFQKLTGMSSANIFNWRKSGYIPINSQHLIEEKTRGALKASWEHSKKGN